MSTLKFLNHKRNIPFYPDCYNHINPFEITLPEVSLINYTLQEIDDLNINELENSWNQSNKCSKKLPLNHDKYRAKKNFSTKLKLFKPVKKFYILEKVRSNKEIAKQKNDYISHCLEMKNYTIEQIIEINKLKNIPFKKFNMILDIDFTMIKAVELNDTTFQKKDTDIEIRGHINNNISFEYYIRYRPYFFQFINEIKNYFNFYISTLGHTNYANKIINDFTKKANITIPQKNIISSTSDKLVKNLDDITPLKNDQNELNNTIIIDDTVNFWIKPPYIVKNSKDIEQCIKCLVPSKRYVINPTAQNDKLKFGILIHNDILEENYDSNKNYSIDVDYPYCIEKDSDSEKTNYGQFYYLEKFVKNCIRFSLFSGVPFVYSMDYYRKKVFEDCKFNLKYLENEWNYCISNMIKELGGNIVIDINETTHFIIENKINMNKIVKQKNNQIFVNINYIFQCYFNLKRMNEFENQFQANIYS